MTNRKYHRAISTLNAIIDLEVEDALRIYMQRFSNLTPTERQILDRRLSIQSPEKARNEVTSAERTDVTRDAYNLQSAEALRSRSSTNQDTNNVSSGVKHSTIGHRYFGTPPTKLPYVDDS